MKRKDGMLLQGLLMLAFALVVHEASAQTWEKYKAPRITEKNEVHETRYDYSDLARKITAGAQGDYQKIRAIYQWICENIAYDTSYKIYTADECIDQKKGVCQAYCELFYQIAEAAGVKVEIISGKAKDVEGKIDKDGHVWLFAYTAPNRGILMDPTWGAGYTRGRKFERRKNCWVWFDVLPEWMLLRHFPDDQSYQLVDNPITWQEFLAMPLVDTSWVEYGVDCMTLYKMARSRNLSLPMLYNGGEGEVELIEFPRQKTLRIGEFYTFRIKMKNNRQFAIINNTIYCETPEWQDEGNGIYSIRFMPRETDKVKFSLKDPASNYWNTVTKYTVEQPTAADWKKVEQFYPLSMPEVKQVKNLSPELWKQTGIDEHQLLKFIRENNLKELPVLYNGTEKCLRIVSVPMNKYLRSGQSYTFQFYPQSGIRWALVNNKEWHENFQVSSDGMYTITVTPASGKLILYVYFKENESYWTCLGYKVK